MGTNGKLNFSLVEQFPLNIGIPRLPYKKCKST